MKKYESLMLRISAEYAIVKGKVETDTQWKTRILYSVLGRMAQASLLDRTEDENASITHMKNRVEAVLESYRAMYPEIRGELPSEIDDLVNEIYNIYLNAGVIYHEQYRIVLATPQESEMEGVCFTRGYPLETKQKISGLGSYMLSKDKKTGLTLAEMFQLEECPLQERWKCCVSRAKWSEYHADTSNEFLRMEAPFTRGYWVNKPYTNGKVSLMRTGFRGTELYYLYRVTEGRLMVSPLPAWQVENYQYRSLACGCLAVEGTLPPITYSHDGDIVSFRFGYLPPPAELYLWKLYSWPNTMRSLPKDFMRVCSKTVFEPIKKCMLQQGYQFVKE